MKKRPKTAFSFMEMAIVILIIFLIVGAISSKSYLIGIANLTSLRSISLKSPIRQISGNTLWIDISSKKAFNGVYPSDKTNIQNLNDLNLYQNIVIAFSQGTSATQPLFLYDTIDHLPLLRFNSNDALTSNNLISGFNLTQPNQITIIAVQKYNSGNGVIFSYGSNSTTNKIAITARASDDKIYFDFGNLNGNAGRAYVAAPVDFDNQWKVLTFVKKVDNTALIRVNGINLALEDGILSSNYDAGTNANINLSNGSSAFDLRELVIFNRELGDDEIADIERYLSNKWKVNID